MGCPAAPKRLFVFDGPHPWSEWYLERMHNGDWHGKRFCQACGDKEMKFKTHRKAIKAGWLNKNGSIRTDKARRSMT